MPASHYRRPYEDAMHQLDLIRANKRLRTEVLTKTLPGLSVDASSPDGSVRLSVNAEGMLTGLHLSETVSRLSPAQLAETVFQTYGSAQREAARQAAEAVVPAFGETGYLQDRLRSRMEAEPTPPQRTERRRAPAPAEDTFEDVTYLRSS